MTGIYECHGEEGIDYYAIVRDGKKFRLKLVKKVGNDFRPFGFLTNARPKKCLIELMENAYQTVTKVGE